MMQYRGYIGSLDFKEEDGVFHGRVVNTRDLISFTGADAAELRQAFHDSIEDYLAYCSAEGAAPEPPAERDIHLVLYRELADRLESAAAARGESIEEFVIRSAAEALPAR